jgi:phage-related holin
MAYIFSNQKSQCGGTCNILYGHLVYFVVFLVYFMVIWYFVGILHKEKSGNPALDLKSLFGMQRVCRGTGLNSALSDFGDYIHM